MLLLLLVLLLLSLLVLLSLSLEDVVSVSKLPAGLWWLGTWLRLKLTAGADPLSSLLHLLPLLLLRLLLKLLLCL